MKAWHFITKDRKLGYSDNRIVKTGRTYKCKGPLVLCENGLHGSKHLIDALYYAPGPILCRVELSGEIIHSDDKSVARLRTVLRLRDISTILHEFACQCAEDALALVDKPDDRSIAAIQAKRDWLKGLISDQELAAARAAARDAAWAARDATREAATGCQDRRLAIMVTKVFKP